MKSTSAEVLRLNNVAAGYEKRRVVQGVTALITQGELVGIIGCNGSGKSTLLKTLRGLLPPLAGAILVQQRALESYSERELALLAAYLPQEGKLAFGYTGKDLVLTGRYPHLNWWQKESRADEELALACMECTGTLDLAERAVNEISGGQKQRLYLARILAQQTPLLFLDEPTTGLDMVYQEEIFRFCQQVTALGKTVLMVVHELNLAARYCSRLLLLGEGKLLADGRPEQVLTPPLLSRAYGAQVAVTLNQHSGGIEVTSVREPRVLAAQTALLAKICQLPDRTELTKSY